MTIIALIIVLSIVAIYIGSIFLHTFFYAHGYDKNSKTGFNRYREMLDKLN